MAAQLAAADPWSAGIMALGSVAGGAMQKTPTQSTGMQSGTLDASNWNVNTGPGNISSSAQKSGAQGLDALLNQGAQLLSNPLVLIGLCLACYLYSKK